MSHIICGRKKTDPIGPYEPNCKAHWATEDDPMPDDFSFQLWNDDLDRIEDIVSDAMERAILGTSGVSRVINGPLPCARWSSTYRTDAWC